ncbi:hypothetical protein [Azospirillum largimobile]
MPLTNISAAMAMAQDHVFPRPLRCFNRMKGEHFPTTIMVERV